jgi:hypothetical protein
VPFGQCVFQDAQTLPGTVVFELFGHEIQLLPRVLTIDRVEHPWHSGETITLSKSGGQTAPRRADSPASPGSRRFSRTAA